MPELRNVYGRPDGRITLTPHIEWWIVHDLGHTFHAHLSYWFPRKWLMELFADLCLYTYVAANEPDYLPRLETVLRLLHQLPAAHFRYHTLHDFDTQYLDMELVNYLWYHGHFFACAKPLVVVSGTWLDGFGAIRDPECARGNRYRIGCAASGRPAGTSPN